jgi:hypothetical protein
MKHVLFHFAPFEPGDNPGEHPGKGTPRFEGLKDAMRSYGLFRADDGKVAVAFTMVRGWLGEGYLWRITWEDASSENFGPGGSCK